MSCNMVPSRCHKNDVKIKMADLNVEYLFIFYGKIDLIQVSTHIDVQEKESHMNVGYLSINLSLGSLFSITRRSLMMPNIH